METHSQKELDLRVPHQEADCVPPPTQSYLWMPFCTARHLLQETYPYILRANYLPNALQQHDVTLSFKVVSSSIS